jgi:hypothetical protein
VTLDDWVLRNPPDRPFGYTLDWLRTVLGDDWPAFAAFMAGRAFLSEELPGGGFEPVVHIDDVLRFLAPASAMESPVPMRNPPEPRLAESQRSERAPDAADGASAARVRLPWLHLHVAAALSASGAAAVLIGREVARALAR